MDNRPDLKRDILTILRDPRYVGQTSIFLRAADEIEALRAALKPFADAGVGMSAKHGDLHGALSGLTINDLRQAASSYHR